MLGFSEQAQAQNMPPNPTPDTVTVNESFFGTNPANNPVQGNVISGMATSATGVTFNLVEDTDPEGDRISVVRYAVGNDIETEPVDVATGSRDVVDTDNDVEAGLFLFGGGLFSFVPRDADDLNALASGASAVFVYTYEINDNSRTTGRTLLTSTLTITINGENDAPTAMPATNLRVANNSTLTLTAANFGFMDVDTDDELEHVTITGLPVQLDSSMMPTTTSAGTLAVNNVDITSVQAAAGHDVTEMALGMDHLVFTPSSTFTGTARITYTVNDGMADSDADAVAADTQSYNLDIMVNAALALPDLGNVTAPAMFTADEAITAIAFTNNGGRSLTGCAVSPPLPTGLTVGRTTGNTSCEITGTPTTTATATTYTVTATNATGDDATPATVSITVAAATSGGTMTEAQMRMERNRDTQRVVTEFARTLSLGAVNTVRQRTLSLGPRSPRAQQSQSSVDVDVTGLLDFAMSRAGVDAPSSGQLLQSLGSSSGGMSGAMMDYAEDYAMSRARQVAAESPAFVNDAQALETERFVGGLEDGGALGDSAAGGAYADLASLGEGLVSSAAGRRGGGWTDGSMRFWASAEHGEVSSSPRTGVSFDDDTTTISLGMEKHFGGNKLLGVAASWLKGEPEFTTAGGVRGSAELEQWSLNPYIAYSFGSSRVWATVGVGVGSMDYSDNRSGTVTLAESDTTSLMYAVGAEQDIAELGGVDLLARVEAAGASLHLSRGDNLYDAQDIDSSGVRAELEAGYSVVAGDGHYRPYVTVGYRADGGDSSSDDAVEYGGGMLIGTDHLTVVASARGQSSTGGGSDDRTSYALELAYDRDGDQRGLNLSVRNSIGNVDSGIWADSYDYGASSSPSMRGLMNMRAGYGHEIGNWLLTPYVESDLDNGDMARWSMGLGADFGTGALELTHTARPGQSAAPGESMLMLRLEFQ